MADDNNPQGTVEEGGFATLAEAANAFADIANEEVETETVETDEGAEIEAEAEVEAQPEADDGDYEEPEEDGQSEKVDPEELRQGYLRQADYTRKTQELAEARRAFEAEQAQAANRLQQTETELVKTLERIKALDADNQEPDWVKMAQEDPLGVVEAQARWNAKQNAIRQAEAKAQQLQEQHAKQHAENVQQYRAQQAELVLKDPLFADVAKDPSKANARQAQLAEFAISQGFSAEDFSEVADARVYRLLEMARRYDVVQKSSKQVEGKAKPAPRNRKPGAARQPDADTRNRSVGQSMSKLSKTGSLTDAARVFAALE